MSFLMGGKKKKSSFYIRITVLNLIMGGLEEPSDLQLIWVRGDTSNESPVFKVESSVKAEINSRFDKVCQFDFDDKKHLFKKKDV